MSHYTAQVIATFLYESLDYYSDIENALEEISEIVENEVDPASVREIGNFWLELKPLEREKIYTNKEIISIIQRMGRAPISEAA